MLEKDIEKKLVSGIRKLKGRCFKWVSPGCNGVPDRIVILPGGRIIFVELKTETGRLEPIQTVMLALLKSLGCDVRVLKGLDEVNRFLQEVGNDRSS